MGETPSESWPEVGVRVTSVEHSVLLPHLSIVIWLTRTIGVLRVGSHRPWAPPNLLWNGYQGKVADAWNGAPPCTVEVNNAWSYASAFPYAFLTLYVIEQMDNVAIYRCYCTVLFLLPECHGLYVLGRSELPIGYWTVGFISPAFSWLGVL